MIAKKSSTQLLQESIIELISEKPFGKVTVTQVAQNCHISVSTFYNHYSDIYDLLRDVVFTLLRLQRHPHQEQLTLRSLIDEGVYVVEKYPDFCCHLLADRQQSDFQEAIQESLCSAAAVLLSDAYDIPLSDELQTSINIYLYGIFGYLSEYLQNSRPESHDHLLHRLLACAPFGLRNCLM